MSVLSLLHENCLQNMIFPLNLPNISNENKFFSLIFFSGYNLEAKFQYIYLKTTSNELN